MTGPHLTEMPRHSTRAERGVFYSVAERPDLRQLVQQVDEVAYPAFMLHTDREPLWPRATTLGALQAVVNPPQQGVG